MITHAQLLELVKYDPETGLFTLRKDGPRLRAGTVLNRDHLIPPSQTRQSQVYLLDHGHILAGRLAWFYMTGEWPEDEVDHRDRDGWNQKWDNLRPSTRSLNQANTLYKTNRSGHKGVHYRADLKKFRAMISIGGKNKSLGHFEKFEDAAAVYAEQAKRHFGEFARFS